MIQKALTADRESKRIEFKREFDPTSRPQWCEVIKDVVAIANSGGGIIVFGLENDGTPSGADLTVLARVDPADAADKITGFTGAVEPELEILSLAKAGHKIVAFLVGAAPAPLVFEKAGSYRIGMDKGCAFAQGTIYFRHGAKSEPARATDLRSALERIVKHERKSWLSGVRKVSQAPRGSKLVVLPPTQSKKLAKSSNLRVSVADGPDAIPAFLTRDSTKANGIYLHEKISQALLDDVNNVIELNRVFAKDQQHFLLGIDSYYRVYAERDAVTYSIKEYDLLFGAAATDVYGPGLFWATKLPPESVAQTLSKLFLFPKNPNIHFLMRMAVLFGEDFCSWLFEKWKEKWNHFIQKPSFYYTFDQMRRRLGSSDPRIIASRLSPTSLRALPDQEPVSVRELLGDQQRAATLLSSLCLRLFRQTDGSLRALARDLDYIVYGNQTSKRGSAFAEALIKATEAKDIADLGADESANSS